MLDQIPYYWLGLTVVIIVLFADRLIKDSRVGRAWEATREDEDAAELMGVPTFKFKLLAFAIGRVHRRPGRRPATPAGRAFINPQSFLLLLSILFLARSSSAARATGGACSSARILVAYLPERFREFADFRVLVFGLALMLLADLPAAGPAAAAADASVPSRWSRRSRRSKRAPTTTRRRPVPDDHRTDRRTAAGSRPRGRRRHAAVRRPHRPRRRLASTSSEGEILGLIGPNGAGKTTCFNVDDRRLPGRPAATSASTARPSPG